MSSFINPISQDHRYSRQSYTIGLDAQTKLSEASILIIGYNTLAQEIIRNLTLIGVSKICIHNKNNLENYQRTGLYYCVEENELPLEQFKKLNPTIQISSIDILDEDKELDKNVLKKFNMVILTNSIIDDGIDINRLTHKLGIPFIMCGCYGLMGYLFNDFGEKFVVNDIDGEVSEPLILESIEGKILKFKDQHKLSDGDSIQIKLLSGEEIEYNVYRKRSPVLVELKEEPEQDKNKYLKLIRKKISKEFNFKPLKKDLENITFNIADWSVGFNRIKVLHTLHLAYGKFLEENGSVPRPWSLSDYEVFEKYFDKFESPEDNMLAKKFCFTLKGDLLPIASIIGGIVSHEVLKGLAHKYIPITQWHYMDYLDLILDSEIETFDDYTSSNYKTKTKYEGIVNILGKRFFEDFQNTTPFVVGSGAIGCEIIKNLGMMGVKQIYLADPDHIEKSNLSRQFLFNDSDIRQSKAETAAKKIKILNPDTDVKIFVQKVCEQTENIFNKSFHSSVDIYLNALDNVDARIYMDSLALKYSKPLIDSGTMGSKGNVQVILPHLTESYGSSKDPDEKAGIPICTLKAFPYKQEHTIQWARELFETEFNLIPSLLIKYKKNPEELQNINDADSKQLLKQLYKYADFGLSQEYFIRLLTTIFYENHFDNIKEIIDKYSKEEHKEELGDKKLPIYLDENEFNQDKWNEYISNGFILLNQIFKTNLKLNFNHINPDEKLKFDFPYDLEKLNSEEIICVLNPIINKLENIDVVPIEFEKDDDELGHVNWICLSSNLRNIQYSIEQTNLYETRKIAGNIIPAMITTTSLISGYQVLEYIKICKLYKPNKYIEETNSKDIDFYKNRFVNLNTNYCDGINPSATKNYKLESGLNISVWTTFKTNTKNTSEIIKQIELNTKKKIEFMTQGNKTIYDGDEINIENIDKISDENILILLEDIPIGIPVLIE
jgi:ubiquitin-activating enzyme E1